MAASAAVGKREIELFRCPHDWG